MLYYTVGQWTVFLFMAATGFAAGVWYGAVSAVSSLMRSGPVLRAICDIVCAAGCWLLFVAGSVASCRGEARLYAFLGAGAGFLLERITLGTLPAVARKMYKRICKFTLDRQEKSNARRT